MITVLTLLNETGEFVATKEYNRLLDVMIGEEIEVGYSLYKVTRIIHRLDEGVISVFAQRD